MAKAKEKQEATGKKADGGKGKKGKKGKSATTSSGRPLSIAAHPQARSSVRRAKGYGGLIGFAVAAFLSLQASVPLAGVGERSLIAGLAGYLLGWACSVVVWRQLMIAELKVAAEEYAKRLAQREE